MTNTSDLDRKLKIFDEKLKSFLASLNIFITIILIFFFLVFLPYATLVGNAVDQRLKDIKNDASALSYREEYCHYNLSELSRNWLKKHRYSQGVEGTNNDLEIKRDLEALEKRVDALKLPLIDKIPASIGEVILFSPAIISIYLTLLLIQFDELIGISQKLSKPSSSEEQETNIETFYRVPYFRIYFLLTVGSFVYLYILVNLDLISKYSSRNCNLFRIIKSQLIYQQHNNFYYFLHFITFLLVLLVILFIFRSSIKRFLARLLRRRVRSR